MVSTELTPETVLTVHELAAAVGPRRAGRPTSPETVRYWMLHGIVGVHLDSQLDINTRRTTWGAYLRFREAVAHVKTETRRQRKEMAKQLFGRRAQKRSEKAQRDAQRKLEAMNAR